MLILSASTVDVVSARDTVFPLPPAFRACASRSARLAAGRFAVFGGQGT